MVISVLSEQIQKLRCQEISPGRCSQLSHERRAGRPCVHKRKQHVSDAPSLRLIYHARRVLYPVLYRVRRTHTYFALHHLLSFVMADALDSIWDLPVENSPARRSPLSKRSTLFLDSGSEDENEAPKTSAPKAGSSKSKNKALIDAMFDDLDDDSNDQELGFAPSLDVEALRREADAQNSKLVSQRSLLPSSPPPEMEDGSKKEETTGKNGKTKRKPPPKLDETLLLSDEGFQALIKEAKNFKPKGKGHEVRSEVSS